MASGQFAVACRQIGRLFGPGTVAGLAEGQLLDRFVARRDDAAFEAIVARHGPMVLAVCRSLLHDPNDVDDAFQAVFLVLVRKADSLRHRDRLGGWLHAVAGRVARRARYDAGRRRDRDAKYRHPEGPAGPEAERLDLREAIHAEVDRLPESYRQAVLLCDLQGRTIEEAAAELGWPVGSVKGRLHRARGVLRDRLARRGLAPGAAGLLVILADEGRAAVSPALFEATARAASAVTAGPPILAGAVSVRVLELTQGAVHAMSTTKLKLAATTLVVAGLAGPGASAYQFGEMPGRPTQKDQVEGKKAAVKATTPVEARIKLAENAIASLQDRVNKGANVTIYDKLFLWHQRLAEARIEAGIPPAEAMKPYIEALRLAEAKLKESAANGGILQADADEAEFRRLKAVESLGDQAGPEASMGTGGMPGMPPGMAGMMGGPGPGRMGPGMGMMGGGMGGMGGGMRGMMPGAGGAAGMPAQGGGGFGGPDEAGPPRRLPKQHPADIERNKLIEERLEKEVTMSFANETPLEEVLKYIKEATKDAKGKSIPIYVNPVGLQSAEKTMQSTIILDLEDVPLRTTLRLLLHQLGLDYRVRDGMLYISDSETLDEEDGIPRPEPPAGGGGLQ